MSGKKDAQTPKLTPAQLEKSISALELAARGDTSDSLLRKALAANPEMANDPKLVDALRKGFALAKAQDADEDEDDEDEDDKDMAKGGAEDAKSEIGDVPATRDVAALDLNKGKKMKKGSVYNPVNGDDDAKYPLKAPADVASKESKEPELDDVNGLKKSIGEIIEGMGDPEASETLNVSKFLKSFVQAVDLRLSAMEQQLAHSDKRLRKSMRKGLKALAHNQAVIRNAVLDGQDYAKSFNVAMANAMGETANLTKSMSETVGRIRATPESRTSVLNIAERNFQKSAEGGQVQRSNEPSDVSQMPKHKVSDALVKAFEAGKCSREEVLRFDSTGNLTPRLAELAKSFG